MTNKTIQEQKDNLAVLSFGIGLFLITIGISISPIDLYLKFILLGSGLAGVGITVFSVDEK